MTITQLYANASRALRARLHALPKGRHPALVRTTMAVLTRSALRIIDASVDRAASVKYPSPAVRRAQIAWHVMRDRPVGGLLERYHQQTGDEIVKTMQEGSPYDLDAFIDRRIKEAGQYALDIERARVAQWNVN